MAVPDQFQFVDNNQDVRIAGSLVDQGATEGDVLTVNADGSISAATAGGGVTSGDGSPTGVVTPARIGALYADDTNGALYVAHGVTDTDWTCFGEIAADSLGELGIAIQTASGKKALYIFATQSVNFTDPAAFAGTGNGLEWQCGGADGTQFLQLFVGPSGNFVHTWFANGVYNCPKGVIFPTSDPHIAGAWWDDSGTLTQSAG